jgi:hypothetical protein
LPLSTRHPNLRDAIASHLPESIHYRIDNADISIYEDCLHFRFASREEAQDPTLCFWIGPVLRAMRCQNFVVSSPDGYAGRSILSSCELLASLSQKESKIKMRLNAVLESIPAIARADLDNVTGSLYAKKGDVIEIRFCNSGKYLGQGYNTLPVVLEALPWLADCDQQGFNKIKLLDISGDKGAELYATFTPQQLQEQRRINLERSL